MEKPEVYNTLQYDCLLGEKWKDGVDVYLKSEMDAYISDLEADNLKMRGQIKSLCEDNAKQLNALLGAARIRRLSNFRRCKDRADWCESTAKWCRLAARYLPAGSYVTLNNKPVKIDPPVLIARSKFLERWRIKWLAYATYYQGV